MDEMAELKALKEQMNKLEESINKKVDNQIEKKAEKYRYCIIRELSGYGTEDWNALMEWAKQRNFLLFNYEEGKEAIYFDASPDVMREVGIDRAGIYVCIDDKFDPR